MALGRAQGHAHSATAATDDPASAHIDDGAGAAWTGLAAANAAIEHQSPPRRHQHAQAHGGEQGILAASAGIVVERVEQPVDFDPEGWLWRPRRDGMAQPAEGLAGGLHGPQGGG